LEQDDRPQTSGRVQYIDLLRGWAVLVMIETHVFNASLSEVVLRGEFFQLIKFVNGLVAPAFLFASGLAFAVTTHRKIADYLGFGRKLFRQVTRLLSIVAIGYLLHLPKFSLHYLLTLTTPVQWESVFQVDILQCIGVSLLIMQTLLLGVRSERWLYVAMGVVSVVVLVCTPVVWSIDFWGSAPPALAEYMNGLHYSLCPLFPWAVFLFSGAISGYVYLQMRGSRFRVLTLFVASGAVLIALSFAAEPLAAKSYTVYNYWRFSPTFVLLRLGLICFLTAGMFLYEEKVGVSHSSAVALIGRESLLVYVGHLLLLYGDFGIVNFQEWSKHSFGYAEAMLTAGIVSLMMYVVAAVWSRLRTRGSREKRIVQLLLATVLVATFLLAPAG
jgi:uncharacterized membrane protein